ncbi:MAG: T9SS type A sorting domain-containing protein [Ignavibacteriota bacterium]|nr:MAG: T9SS C-terminal target domain-containing protein [Chlorobiota bacterium]MBE7476911.1 T9SS type A sorting domain-containing protein [Ignavibacteriales bacterium]NUM61797.1 T9SS type A sorting domain-containing protein [Ignavibacteriaceae bacterium]QKJ97985.1 MAG: T9SS type A sorting domain-containing protein [Ignavibacteriota bacterium]
MIYRYDNTQGLPEDEYLIDDLLAIIGDTIQSFRMGYPWIDGYTLLLEESIFTKWGLSKPKKIFEQYDLMMPRYSLTQDIGLDSLTYSFDFGYTEAYLKGCVINDILLGDTTVVSVEDEEIPIATEFRLEQNYPNPFNPSTKIKYQIPATLNPSKGGTLVQLIVYDILGNQIATLVNEEKQSGVYEVEFDGSNLPSGIYFYQLRTGDIVQTKKMVYLK